MDIWNPLTVQILNYMFKSWTMKNDQDHFEVLRKIDKNPESSQRELAESLGFSLGKLNYCLKALKNKGLVKIKNFQKKKIKSIIFTHMFWHLKELHIEQN